MGFFEILCSYYRSATQEYLTFLNYFGLYFFGPNPYFPMPSWLSEFINYVKFIFASYSTHWTNKPFITNALTFALKFISITALLVFVRGGIPRYRYDFLTKIGWLKLLSLTLTYFLTLGLILYLFS